MFFNSKTHLHKLFYRLYLSPVEFEEKNRKELIEKVA